MLTGSIIYVLTGQSGGVKALALNSDNSLLVSASNDRSVRIWILKNGYLRLILNGHIQPVIAV